MIDLGGEPFDLLKSCCRLAVTMASVEGSFASPSAEATLSSVSTAPTGFLMKAIEGMNVWSALLGLLILLVAYDQSSCYPYPVDDF